MTRDRLLAAAAVLALVATLLNQRAAAQQSEGAQPASASESASADTSASSDQSSSTSDNQSATQSDTQPSTQADTQSSQSSSADNQSNSTGTQSSGQTDSNSTNQADNQSTATADNQTSASGTASSQTDGAATSQQDSAANASGQTDIQESAPPVPAPTSADTQNANQPRDSASQFDRSPNRADASAPGRGDVNAQGRLDSNAQRRLDANARTQTDLRAGIQFGRPTNRGLVIDRVDNNSFFHTSGFRRGDILVSYHGRPIRSEADFRRFVVMYPGQRVPVVVLRGGQRETIFVEAPDQVAHSTNRVIGPAQAGGAYLGVIFDAQARDAAVVLRVNPGSPAEEAGLQAGDLMLALNGQEVRSYPQAISVIRSMQPGQELEIIVDRARSEQQIVAVLDAQPAVRTATRPSDDVIIDRQTVPAGVDVEINRENSNRATGNRRLLDRSRSEDGFGNRRLLPGRRN
jgi:membrane-associated protease RseP (regulator of RpoE activity)